MNYIERLRIENAGLRREVEAVKTGLDDLRAYLHSSKFRCGDRLDNYVNVADVLAYLRNAQDAGTLARESEVAA